MFFMKIVVKSPAKINLYLDILGKRTDGYHNVNMIMQSVSLFDTVTVSMACEEKIEISSNVKFDGDEKTNTAYIAANEFFKYTGVKVCGLNIHLEKKIPVCAGLAGGSTDAAGVLLALNEIFKTNLSKNDLADIGKNVGADVPFCVFGGTMLSSGTGTTLTALSHMPDCHIVIVKPKISVSTQKAYAMSDKLNQTNAPDISDLIDEIKSNSLKLMSDCMYNKFEQVLNLDEIDKIKNVLIDNGAIGTSMSGSGPSVFGIFNDEGSAKLCTSILKEKYNDVFLCNPIKTGCYIENKIFE